MKALLDTSIMVAAHLPAHPDYAVASAWLGSAKQKAYELFVSAHSVAEVYAVLTRLRTKPKIKGPTAWKLLQENVLSVSTVVELSGDNYKQLLSAAATAGIVGGATYDAVIAKAAELAQVDHLVTLNEGDFRRVNATMASRVVSPHHLDPPKAAS